jgi:type II secretory pathway predicted ATPase ExeA
MYERFFGLRERPFDLTPNPRFLVMTDGHREALSNLEYAIAARKGIALLLGDAGCGKTTIIRAAIERQPSRVHCVHVTNPALTRDEFVETLATQFQLTDSARRSKAALLSELEALLVRRRNADETTVLVIDEAQSLSNELLEEIRLLANIETDDDKLISLVLAGQPELSQQLNQDALRQFKQRVALRCELRPLTAPETLGYLAGRVRAAGGVASRMFTREAATLLHQYSRGIPRLVNVLADNALLAAFGKQSAQVTSQLVTDVARDFQLTTPSEGHREAGPPPEVPAAVQSASPPRSALFAIGDESPESPAAGASDASQPVANTMFGSFSAKRLFPFLGRRGTA